MFEEETLQQVAGGIAGGTSSLARMSLSGVKSRASAAIAASIAGLRPRLAEQCGLGRCCARAGTAAMPPKAMRARAMWPSSHA